ncbi:MAG: polysaccharide biosynthesis protein [Candidatus Parcubacteria bacterium]|nr:MAG: polysaccharide biosynthesis protein [Candidatus Parcubacteria bacterium]
MIKKIFQYLLRNFSEEQRIVKNSFWIALARFGGSLLRAILIIYAFRILGPSLQGSFSLAMNFILIFSFIPDFGLTAVLIREIIKNQGKKKEILANAFLVVFILLFLSLIIINLSKSFFIKDPLAQTLISILSIFLIFDTLREFLYSLFRAKEKMELQAFSHLLTNFLLLFFGILLLKLNPLPYSLAQAYFLASFIGFIFTFFLLKKEIVFNYLKFFQTKIVFDLLNKSWPIGIANFLFLIITYLDSLIVGWFHPAKDVGLYSSVVKLIEFLYFFPAALAMAVFPILSKKNSQEFQQTIAFGFQLALFISLPILGGLLVLAKDIIAFIFGSKYIDAYPGLQLVSFAIPFNFLLLILVDALIALDKRKELLIYDFVVLVLNFILNLIFVPQFSYFASSAITSISSLLSLIFAYLILKKYAPISLKEVKISNYLLSTILMMILIYILPVHLILKVIIGALFYFLFLFILKDPLFVKLKKFEI